MTHLTSWRVSHVAVSLGNLAASAGFLWLGCQVGEARFWPLCGSLALLCAAVAVAAWSQRDG